MSKRFIKALDWAAHSHRLHRRKGAPEPVRGKCPRATPYINHLISVVRLLSDEGGVDDEDVLIAAILHDLVEDTEASLADVKSRFGTRVASIVGEVTDDRTLSREDRKAEQVRRASSLSQEAKVVKLADKLHNCTTLFQRPPLEWSQERIRDYLHWAAQVVEGVRGVNPELEAMFDAMLKKSEKKT